jgi:hypothetical protein
LLSLLSLLSRSVKCIVAGIRGDGFRALAGGRLVRMFPTVLLGLKP